MSNGFVNLSRPTLENATVSHPAKIRVPTGYTLLAFPDVDNELRTSSDDTIRVSIYPPGSDCVDQDDRVGEFWLEREGADVILRMFIHA